MSQDDQYRAKRLRPRSLRAINGTHYLTQEIARRMGISVRQAYRITASIDQVKDRRGEQQALLARYILLEVADPGHATALTDFLDDLFHALIEDTTSLEPACLDRRWAKMAGKQIADNMHKAVARREQRLHDNLEIP